MKKKIMAIFLTIAMAMSLLPMSVLAAPAGGFGDTDQHWGENAIIRWSGYNVIQGDGTNFFPNDEMTRAELAQVLCNILGLPAGPGGVFGDVKESDWFAGALNACAAANIMLGDGVNARPNDPVSREETMVLLARALHITPADDADLSGFGDANNVSTWAAPYMAAMTEKGIINGIDGNLEPGTDVNRASVVTMLDRAVTTYACEPGETVTASGDGIVLVVADNVTVTGQVADVVVAQGASESAVTLSDATVTGSVTVAAEKADVAITGTSNVASVTLDTQAQGAKVEVAKDATVTSVETKAPESSVAVSGTVANVAVAETAGKTEVQVTQGAKVDNLSTAASESRVNVNGAVTNVTVADTAGKTEVTTGSSATIEKVDTKADNVTIGGSGKVENAEVSGNDTTVSTGGTKVDTAEGTTGTTAGNKPVEGGSSTTTTPSTPSGGSSGGSNRPSHSHSYEYTHVEGTFTAKAQHIGKCTSNDDTLAAVACSFVDSATEADGTVTKTCSVCGYAYNLMEDDATASITVVDRKVTVSTAAEMCALAEILKTTPTYQGDLTVTIDADIDMANTGWVPIKVEGYTGTDIVTIDADGHAITGLKAPLFEGGFAGGSGIVINGLTIADSEIVSTNTLGSGAFIEAIDSMDTITLTNCHLLNSTVTGSRTGGLIGWNSGYNNVNDGPVQTRVEITGCSVVGCEITGAGTVGGIVGHAGANAWTWNTISNCTVKDCDLTSNDDSYRVGVVVGTANVGEVTISGITNSGNTLKQNNDGTEITRPEGQSDLYGRFVPQGTGVLIINGDRQNGSALPSEPESNPDAGATTPDTNGQEPDASAGNENSESSNVTPDENTDSAESTPPDTDSAE